MVRSLIFFGLTGVVLSVLLSCVDSRDPIVPVHSFSNLTGCHGSGSSVTVNDSGCTSCAEADTTVGGDWSKCINLTAHSLGDGGTLLFRRGETYNVSSALYTGGCPSWSDIHNVCSTPHQHNNTTWAATGTGVRPIIKFTALPPGVGPNSEYHTALKVTGHDVTLSKLDIRGTSYNTKGAPVTHTEGINATTMAVEPSTMSGDTTPTGLLLDSVQINGFPSFGMIWAGADLTVRNSQIRYNSLTGLALFHNHVKPSPVVTVTGSSISVNGGDGIDMTSSFAIIDDNTIESNGWVFPLYGATSQLADSAEYEGFGIILNPSGMPFGGAVMDSVTVRNNVIAANGLSGITLISDMDDTFSRIKIDDNFIEDHSSGYARNSQSGGWAVHFGKRYDSGAPVGDVVVSNSFLRGNCATGNDGNGSGSSFNIPFDSVTAQNNMCSPPSVDIAGPWTTPLNEWCTWTASVSGGTPPYSYRWYRDGGFVSPVIDYTGDTGTTDFFLRLEVTDAVNQTGWKELLVDVKSGVSC